MSQPSVALLEDGFYEVSPWQKAKRWRMLSIAAGVVILGLTIGLVITGVQLHNSIRPNTNFKPKNLIFFIGGNVKTKILRVSDLDFFQFAR